MAYVVISKRKGRKYDDCVGRFPTRIEAEEWRRKLDAAWAGRPLSRRPVFVVEELEG